MTCEAASVSSFLVTDVASKSGWRVLILVLGRPKSLKLQKRVFKEPNNTKKDWLLYPTTDNRPITIDCNKLTPQVNQVFLIIKCTI